jgi:hypothetical protein
MDFGLGATGTEGPHAFADLVAVRVSEDGAEGFDGVMDRVVELEVLLDGGVGGDVALFEGGDDGGEAFFWKKGMVSLVELKQGTWEWSGAGTYGSRGSWPR